MIRVLLIIPSFDPMINEMAMVWEQLTGTGDVTCTVICRSRDVLKGRQATALHERRLNLEIHRVPRLVMTPALAEIARHARPNVVFCGVHNNMRLARSLAAITHVPIVLHDEYFLDDAVFLNRRYHGGIPPLRTLVSGVVRRRLHAVSALVFSSNPTDFVSSSAARFPRLRYLPWPHPSKIAPAARSARESHRSVFIGSLSRYKGAETLFDAIAALQDAQPDFRWELVGPAVDEQAKQGLSRLLGTFPQSVHHRETCTREEALQLLRTPLFVLSPGERWGWGLIGDAWTVGTPIVAHAEHYDLRSGVNCLTFGSSGEFVGKVRLLQEQPELWERLSAGGVASAEEHTILHVAAVLRDGLSSVLRAPARNIGAGSSH
jgi:glycosyltransferase involved in cell wall biosynthesis